MERWLTSLYTDGSKEFISPLAPKIMQKLTIRLRVLRDNPIVTIYLRAAPEGEEVLLPMTRYRHDTLFSWYHVQTTMVPKVLKYRFKIACPDIVYWFNAAGVSHHTPMDDEDFRIIADFSSPKWLQNRVFYQIFPDSFCNSNQQAVIPQSRKYQGIMPQLRPWGSTPREYKQAKNMDFFGGDLQGIKSKISYLKKLGINALYLNPIFHAPSNHRYDVQDYFKIDPRLGKNKDFANLVTQLHRNHIRIILDGVFNHCGIACGWFNKENYYRNPGAYQDQQSPFAEFYTFIKHPDQYVCWQGVDTLPKFNFRSQKLRNMLYNNSKSVMRFWLKQPYNIDGWRLDVANMLARQGEYQAQIEVFGEMRRAVKETNPDAYLMGEHFFDASDILQGNCLDATMNYFGFTHPVREWLTGWNLHREKTSMTTYDLHKQLTSVRARFSWQIAAMQYNLINCHDIPRLLFLVQDPSQYRLATVFMFAYLGIPSVYYGDETGISAGMSVESSRACMQWDQSKWDMECWQLHQQLIQLRKKSLALQKGGLKALWAQENIYSFARFYQQEVLIITLNRSPLTEHCNLDGHIVGIPGGSRLYDILSGAVFTTQTNGMLSMDVGGYQAMILRQQL